jgi:uncharacterized protein YndB with AHSA1/START domain
MTTTPGETGFTIVRTFDATVQQVWDAWTDPDELARWLQAPRETFEVNLRPDGRYRYTLVNESTGDRYPTGGAYLVVEPPTRLDFSWGYPDASPEESMLISLRLAPEGSGCRMTFAISRVEAMRDLIQTGWEEATSALAALLEAAR